MKKSILSFAALAIAASFTTTSTAASLDVHGDIKVHGKVVIDANGNLVNNNANENIVDLAEYSPAGNVTVTLARMSNNVLETYKLEYVNGKQVTDETSINGVVSWSMKWSDRTDNAVTVTSGDANCETVRRNEFELSNGYVPVELGHTTSRMDKFVTTIISASCDEESVGNMNSSTDIYLVTPIVQYDYKYTDGQVAKDCILVNFSANWLETDQPRTLCKGVGPVELGKVDNPYKLVSIVE